MVTIKRCANKYILLAWSEVGSREIILKDGWVQEDSQVSKFNSPGFIFMEAYEKYYHNSPPNRAILMGRISIGKVSVTLQMLERAVACIDEQG